VYFSCLWPCAAAVVVVVDDDDDEMMMMGMWENPMRDTIQDIGIVIVE
jgi:hypothetical protein